MEKNKNLDWQKDFTDFLAAESATVPEALNDKILSPVRTELNPPALQVFTKAALIHTLVGALTLLVCPQFGLSLTNSPGLMPFLMRYGESICMLGCGAIFTMASLLAISFLLRPEEVRVLKERQVLQLALLATLSLGAFLCIGGEVVLTLAMVWSLGAILGGALSLEVGWAYRRFLFARQLT